jgi:hypothetical protein
MYPEEVNLSKYLLHMFRYSILIILAFNLASHLALAQQANVPDRQVNQDVHMFIDHWHLAAANADAKTFFGSMDDNSIYIGTDATERWTKDDFIKYAKPYFDRGKAWTFKPYDRDLHVTNDGNFAWFSELLNTRFGVCRGSGILRKTADDWKIEQYHLSVTVPNELVNDFISLVDNFSKQKK